MATDRDEQQRDQQRQAQELEEIRRSFAAMGARMGSLFEPAEAEAGEPERPQQAALPPTQAPGVFEARPRWWWAGALVLLFVAGTAFGWILPKGGDDPDPAPPPQAATATTGPRATTTQTTAQAPPVVSVPESCVEAAELADEVISGLNRNNRNNRLALALRDYTIASQACRREASP